MERGFRFKRPYLSDDGQVFVHDHMRLFSELRFHPSNCP